MNAGRWLVAAVAATGIAIATAAYVDRSTSSPPSIAWKADAERPVAQEWASSRADPPGPAECPSSVPPDLSSGRIVRSREEVAQGRWSYAITAAPGDDCHGERAELGQDNPGRDGFTQPRLFRSGDERYISFQVFLAPNFDVEIETWRVIAQLHQPGGDLGPPPLALNVEDGEFLLYKGDSNDDSDGTVSMWSAPAVTGRWVKFTLRVKFSADSEEGFVELWGNPAGGDVVQLLPKTSTYTMKRDATGVALPLHARIGIYRNPAGDFGTETAYYDGFTVARTREAAEANAFASGAQ
jgi:hypothetical protein